MKITKHGKTTEKENTENFKCEKCGCEFSAKKDEYYLADESNHFCISSSITYHAICSCPECHKIIKKDIIVGSVQNIYVGDPYTYSDSTSVNLSNANCIKIDAQEIKINGTSQG